MEKEQGVIDLLSRIDGVYEYENMIAFIKDLILQTREETLREVLPEKQGFIYSEADLEGARKIGKTGLEEETYMKGGVNLCIDMIKQKAKEIWGLTIN